VLLSMRILFKSLVHCFVNRVTVVNIKFIHMYFLFTGYEYVVFFESVQKFSFSGFPFLLSLCSLYLHMYVLCLICVRSILYLVSYFI
jgi:hypothetical protein